MTKKTTIDAIKYEIATATTNHNHTLVAQLNALLTEVRRKTPWDIFDTAHYLDRMNQLKISNNSNTQSNATNSPSSGATPGGSPGGTPATGATTSQQSSNTSTGGSGTGSSATNQNAGNQGSTYDCSHEIQELRNIVTEMTTDDACKKANNATLNFWEQRSSSTINQFENTYKPNLPETDRIAQNIPIAEASKVDLINTISQDIINRIKERQGHITTNNTTLISERVIERINHLKNPQTIQDLETEINSDNIPQEITKLNDIRNKINVLPQANNDLVETRSKDDFEALIRTIVSIENDLVSLHQALIFRKKQNKNQDLEKIETQIRELVNKLEQQIVSIKKVTELKIENAESFLTILRTKKKKYDDYKEELTRIIDNTTNAQTEKQNTETAFTNYQTQKAQIETDITNLDTENQAVPGRYRH